MNNVIVPCIPTEHILPGKEPGFMNLLSLNFSRTGYDVWVDRLRRNRL
ncbi:MAG: hypothetical protein RQ739_04300 [Desulfotignum sp.]|nr:hypothetical protein [Desulfotignum sp.]